jgi:hypothetical protein
MGFLRDKGGNNGNNGICMENEEIPNENPNIDLRPSLQGNLI